MRGLLAAAAVLLGSATAAAVAAPVNDRIDVVLASFRFSPRTITLHHGQHYTLRLTNAAKGGHDFVAKEFFATARLDADAVKRVRAGGVELAGGATVDIGLVATKPGRYPLHCSHFMHSTFGMTGEIRVD